MELDRGVNYLRTTSCPKSIAVLPEGFPVIGGSELYCPLDSKQRPILVDINADIDDDSLNALTGVYDGLEFSDQYLLKKEIESSIPRITLVGREMLQLIIGEQRVVKINRDTVEMPMNVFNHEKGTDRFRCSKDGTFKYWREAFHNFGKEDNGQFLMRILSGFTLASVNLEEIHKKVEILRQKGELDDALLRLHVMYPILKINTTTQNTSTELANSPII